MAAEHCQAGYWLVWFRGWTGDVEAPTNVEHLATFEDARLRYAALGAPGEAATVEVYDADGALLLSEALDCWRWSMSQPRAAGSYRWNDSTELYEAVQTADDASPLLVG